MTELALSASFEYSCYGSTLIINIIIFIDYINIIIIFYSAEIDFRRLIYRRQILTSKVDPRAVRVSSPRTLICPFIYLHLGLGIAAIFYSMHFTQNMLCDAFIGRGA